MSLGVVVVTGGSRGIGAETAVASARAGYDVVVGYVDPAKEKRVRAVLERIEEHGRQGRAVQADITKPDARRTFMHAAFSFADDCSTEVTTIVLNAAGGLEGGGTQEYAEEINKRAPLALAKMMVRQAKDDYSDKEVVYVTSNPSHFYGNEHNVMPSDVYDVVASTKHAGERALRNYFNGVNREEAPVRLLVATADLVDGTAGATLLRMAHRRSTGDRTADLIAERSTQLEGLIGRGVTKC